MTTKQSTDLLTKINKKLDVIIQMTIVLTSDSHYPTAGETMNKVYDLLKEINLNPNGTAQNSETKKESL
jgi:predicted neutral ceramidase superfamily lipid hydrolase